MITTSSLLAVLAVLTVVAIMATIAIKRPPSRTELERWQDALHASLLSKAKAARDQYPELRAGDRVRVTSGVHTQREGHISDRRRMSYLVSFDDSGHDEGAKLVVIGAERLSLLSRRRPELDTPAVDASESSET